MKHKELIAAIIATASLASVGFGSLAFAATDTSTQIPSTNTVSGLVTRARALLSGTAPTTAQRTALRAQRDAEHAAVDAALTNGDYAAFTAAIANKPKPDGAPAMTEAVFAKMVEAHKLHAAGDTAGAEKIMSDLGFTKPAGRGGMGGKGMHGRGMGEGMRGMKNMVPPTLTDAQKIAWDSAKKLFDAGKRDEAKKVLDAAGIQPPQRGSRGMQNTAQPTGTAAPSL